MRQDEFSARREHLAAMLPALEIDAFLLSHLPNIRYLTGFTGSNALLLLTRFEATLFTDPRYTIQAQRETQCKVAVHRHPILAAAAKAVTRKRYRAVGFEPAHATYSTFSHLREKTPRSTELKPVTGAVETVRMVKSDAEIGLIRAAVLTNSKALQQALKRYKPGIRECDLAAEIDYQMRRLGAEGTSFDTIVVSGERAALPHARPGMSPIAADQLLLIDMGATQAGYTSDMTRTVFAGSAPARWKQIYDAVLESQLAAIAAVRHGAPASRPDREARRVLKAHNLDRNFTHSTGHGLGLEIHEAPRLGRGEKTKLQAGMVVTIEPGVYLEGEGGIRIEDTVLVTRNGCEILTPTSKELTII